MPNWLYFGVILAVLGGSGGILGRLGRVLAPLGGLLGRLWPVLRASWRILGRLGCVLARLWRDLPRLGALLARKTSQHKSWTRFSYLYLRDVRPNFDSRKLKKTVTFIKC